MAIRKSMLFRTLAATGVLIFSPWRDARRYVKIKQFSRGSGHPGNVPAGGTRGYPKDRAGRAADGTGEFDSARRGGPARTQ